jgi:hypothetical protein
MNTKYSWRYFQNRRSENKQARIGLVVLVVCLLAGALIDGYGLTWGLK